MVDFLCGVGDVIGKGNSLYENLNLFIKTHGPRIYVQIFPSQIVWQLFLTKKK